MYYLINLFSANFEQVPHPAGIPGHRGIAIITLLVGWWFFTSKSDEFAYRV
jgi:ABC-type polysaccharide/polyol phosphate export permease